jgi:drug/metabolite transporter (DMT)-like permease
MKQNQRQAILFALISVLFWSTIASAFKISLRHGSILMLLLVATLTAVIVLGIQLLIRKQFNEVFQVSLKDYLMSAVMGLLNPFFYYLILLKAYDLLPAQEAGTLNYIWPLVLVLLSIPVLKQRISFLSVIAVIISFSGILVISTQGHVLSLSFSHPFGVFLAVFSAFLWAAYWLINMKDYRNTLPKMFLNFLFGLLFLIVYGLIIGTRPVFSLKGVLGAVYIGIFEMGLTFVFWLTALKKASNTAKVSQLIYLSPFISLFFIQLVVGEPVLLSTIIGLFLIITGIIMQQYFDRQKHSN